MLQFPEELKNYKMWKYNTLTLVFVGRFPTIFVFILVNEIITRHITRNPFTLGYTYSYTLLYTKTHRIYTKLQIVT